MKNSILFIVLIMSYTGYSQPIGYGFVKQISIQASQVSGTTDLVDFPVLISVTDTDLRTTTNGGNIESTNGYDILFTTDDCTVQLDHQIEKYSPVTGEYIVWVRIPTLFATMNTVISMYYGNSAVTVNPSTTNTWNSNYFGVYHFNSSVADGSANGNNLTDNLTTNFTTSIIGEGRDLDNSTNTSSSSASGSYLRVPNGVLAGVSDFSFSGWVFQDRDDTNWERIFDFGQDIQVNFFFTPSRGAGSPSQTRSRITTGGNTLEQGVTHNNPSTNSGNWLYWVVTIDNATSTMNIYRNGVLYDSSGGVTFTPNSMEPSTNNYLGRSQYNADHLVDAKFDEFRFSNTHHSADWIATEYNNQNSPATFYTISAEMTSSVSCAALSIELLNFSATAEDHKHVELYWQTASEVNNDYFTLERSVDGITWEIVTMIDGAGNSSKLLDYSATDKTPYPGISYYRLKQTDFDGKFNYSQIRSVAIPENSEPNIYPNPLHSQLTIEGSVAELKEIIIYNLLGQDVTPLTQQITKDKTKSVIDVSQLKTGIYYIKTKTILSKVYKQ